MTSTAAPSPTVTADAAHPAAPASTRERILDAAEQLFATKGIDGVSLREITMAAGVNIAAVSYHFGSKEAVLEELFTLRGGPIAQQRLDLLAAIPRNAQGRPQLEDVLRAFLKPALEAPSAPGGTSFVLLRARLAFEKDDVRRTVLGKTFDASNRAFLQALGQALPELSPDDIYWGFHFLLGSMVYTMAAPGRIEAITQGSLNTSDSAAALNKLVAFAAAGFKAAKPSVKRGA